MHVHINVLHAFLTLLEVLLAWIPVKLVAANFADTSPLAAAVVHVL